MLRVGYFQHAPVFGEVRSNLNTVINALNDVSADIVVLPELPFTGYYFKDREELENLAEDPRDSSTLDALVATCKKQDFYIATGFAEKAKDKVFNSALLVGPEGLVHTYRKLHLFSTEKEYFDPGDTPLEVVDVRGAKVGMMVCFDWVFPEVARTLTLAGADIICHPSNLVLNYCQEAMISRSVENSIFSITANRFGVERTERGEIAFTGQSQIVTPRGKVLKRAAKDSDALFITEIDPSEARNKTIGEGNDLLQDRRPEFYKA